MGNVSDTIAIDTTALSDSSVLQALLGSDTLTAEEIEANRLALLDSIFDYLCNSQILHKDIVFKQIVWETGWLKGDYLMSRNNLFGFKIKKYMSFESWQESIDYYERWQQRKYTNHEEDYYKFLVRIRFSNHRYPSHLKKLDIERTCDTPTEEEIQTADL